MITCCAKEQNTRGGSELLKVGVPYCLVVDPFSGFADKLTNTQCFHLKSKAARAEDLIYELGLSYNCVQNPTIGNRKSC